MNYRDLIEWPEELSHLPKRIVLHWTAGTHRPNTIDLEHYHYLVEGDGEVVRGQHPVEANMRMLKNGDEYAAHTRRFNSYSLGVSFCGMRGATPGGDLGKWPLKEKQVMKGLRFVAALCLAYGLNPLDSHHVFTHYEAEYLHGVDQVPVGQGTWKWDITELGFLPNLKKNEAGNWIRRQIQRQTDILIPVPDIKLALPQPSPMELGWPEEVVSFYGPDDPDDLDKPIP